jgi:hypothetical protein
MNVSRMVSVDHRNIATTGSVRKLARNVERELHARPCRTIVPSVNAQRITSDHHSLNVNQSVTEMLTVPDQDQLATMESARTLAMELVEPMLTATSVD